MKIWINADDYGLTKSCTDAIFECFEKGLISTTTMVVNTDVFNYALEKIKNSPYADKVGLHINLTEGKPLTEGISKNKKFCDEQGNFIGFPNRYSRLSKLDKKDVHNEIEAQFNKILEAGLRINHVDSHHHVHNSFRIIPIILRIMKEKNISSLRKARNVGKLNLFKKMYKAFINSKIKKYSYSKYMGDLSDFENMKNKNSEVVFEVMVHPDYNKSNEIIDRNNADYSNPTGPVFKHEYQIMK